MKPTTKMYVHRLSQMLAFAEREGIKAGDVCPGQHQFGTGADEADCRLKAGERWCRVCMEFMGIDYVQIQSCPCDFWKFRKKSAFTEARKRIARYRAGDNP